MTRWYGTVLWRNQEGKFPPLRRHHKQYLGQEVEQGPSLAKKLIFFWNFYCPLEIDSVPTPCKKIPGNATEMEKVEKYHGGKLSCIQWITNFHSRTIRGCNAPMLFQEVCDFSFNVSVFHPKRCFSTSTKAQKSILSSLKAWILTRQTLN